MVIMLMMMMWMWMYMKDPSCKVMMSVYECVEKNTSCVTIMA